MTDYSASVAVHGTLTKTVVDEVTLTDVGTGMGTREPTVTVTNRSGTAAIYVTLSTEAGAPADPSPAADDTFVIPAKIGIAARLPAHSGVETRGVVVKLVSGGTAAYSVEAI